MWRKAVICLLCLACALCVEAKGIAEPSKTFDTPEAAIEHYLSAIARNDMADALSATILTVLDSGYDFSQHAEYMGSYQLFEASRLPSEYALYKDIMAASQLGNQAKQLWIFCVTTILPFDKLLNTVKVETVEDAVAMAEILDPNQLRSLTVLRIDTPALVEEWIQSGAEQIMLRSEGYRASAQTHRIALIQGPSGLRMAGFRMIELADSWWIARMEGPMDQSGSYAIYTDGFVVEVTEDEYLSLLVNE